VNFIRGFKEKINGLTDSSFISVVLIMDDFNYSIRERQVHKSRLFDVRKTVILKAVILQKTIVVSVNFVKQKVINIRIFVKSIIWKF